MKKCPYCGKENPDDSAVCEKCFAGFPQNEPKEVETSEETEEPSRKKRKIRS